MMQKEPTVPEAGTLIFFIRITEHFLTKQVDLNIIFTFTITILA